MKNAVQWSRWSHRSYWSVLLLVIGIPALICGCGGGSTISGGSSGGSGGGGSNTTPLPQPQITYVTPNPITVGSGNTTILVHGTGFASNSTVQWNGGSFTTIPVFEGGEEYLTATVPAADLTALGTASVTVDTPGASPSTSTPFTVAITNPQPPTLTSLSPNAGPINSASSIALTGTGFGLNTVVEVNGQQIPTEYKTPTSLTATIPAAMLAHFGNVSVTVTTPPPYGGTTSAQAFTVYLPISANDIVYNSMDGLLYASVPLTSPEAEGNSVVGIDPNSGKVMRQIWVGSDPNRLAVSTDGTQLFVGLDGAASVAQVDLTQDKVVNQFYLGGGQGFSNAPLTADYLAAVPASPNSVAVATSDLFSSTGTGITIYDSGAARANAWTSGAGPMSFGPSASTLFVVPGASVEQLSVDSTGVTAATKLASLSRAADWLQYDSGDLYTSMGQELSASTGALLGTFYVSSNTPATGSVVSDSALGRAFIANTIINGPNQVLAFDESSFNLLGNIMVNGAIPNFSPNSSNSSVTAFEKIVRWGQNGLALNSYPNPFSLQSQIYLFQSPLVKDLSSSPADLSVTLSAPGTAATGSAASWTATVKNLGPNTASGVTVALDLDSSLILGSVNANQGSCGGGTAFSCDLGSLGSGASATVTVSATPSQSGTLESSASVISTSYDPISSNDQATASTTVTGGTYSAVPTLSAISPNSAQAGSSGFTLTVTGNGFNADSTVHLGSDALSTTYLSATQLTATVPPADVANYGWLPVTVSNPSPGGGLSPVLPFTVYDLVNVPVSGLVFDPYSQMLYATVPSTATTIAGDSVVSINPMTGKVGTPVAVGSGPTVMTETTDGDYLYIGLSGTESLAKFDLSQQSVVNTIPLSSASSYIGISPIATALAAMPGTDSTVAVDFSRLIGIFDISGNSGTFRPNFASYNFPTFGDATHLYTYDDYSTGVEFDRYSINSGGFTLLDANTLNGMGGFNVEDGIVYGYAGGIINPLTTPPTQIATLPLNNIDGLGNSGIAAGAAADPSLQREYIVFYISNGSVTYGLARYNLKTYLPEAVLDLPSVVNTFNSTLPVFRFGQDGLAMMTSTSIGTNSQSPSVLLLRGPFVAPQELGTDTAATLTSSSSATIPHGSGNTMLTLTGSNFQPGVAVTWDGSYRTTTIVDATHVTVAIPASDLASAGSASLVATNPGAPASNTLTVTIN